MKDVTAILCNLESPASVEITRHYCETRDFKNVIDVRCPDSALRRDFENIDYETCHNLIIEPIKEYLRIHPKTAYLITTKGLPIRVKKFPDHGLNFEIMSLDSLLAALEILEDTNAKVVNFDDSGWKGRAMVNPFWKSEQRFDPFKFHMMLVTRLDGYTAEDAKELTNRAVSAEKNGLAGEMFFKVCPKYGYSSSAGIPVDFPQSKSKSDKNQSFPDMSFEHWNSDLKLASELLKEKFSKIKLDESKSFPANNNLAAYVSWGSNDAFYSKENYLALKFNPGALAETAVSSSGRTFLPVEGGQSLAADLIARGVTGMKCYVDEPFLAGISSPSIFLDRYLRGWNLAECFYASSRFTGWTDLVIGDPMCAPFASDRTVQ